MAILATDGVEQVELEQPCKAVEDAGAQTELLSINSGEIQAMNQDIEPGDTFAVDREVSDASVDEFDALLLPGGTVNPDRLRIDEDAMRFVHDFFGSGKPIGAIYYGPWSLVEGGCRARAPAHVVSEHPHRPAQHGRRGRRRGGRDRQRPCHEPQSR